jgi:hypothetical protein
VVCCKDLAAAFDVSRYPDFYNGKATKCDIVGRFLSQFDCCPQEGKISLQQFIDYYTDLSVGITSDEYF